MQLGVMGTQRNGAESSCICLNDLNRSLKSFIGFRGSKGCSLASLWVGVLGSHAPDVCLNRFVWKSCLRLHGQILHVVDLKESKPKRMQTVQHDSCYNVWEEEKVREALNTLEVHLPNIEEAKLIGLVPFKAFCHRELGLYPDVNLKMLDLQALEVIGSASKAGATVADVAEGLKGFINISGPERGKNHKRLDDVKNIHFIICKLLARKLIARVHGEKSNMNLYCLTSFVKEFMREDVKIDKQFWGDEVMPLFGNSSNLSISLEELRSRLKLSSSLIPAIKDALINKETGQSIALKLHRPRYGARYYGIKWFPDEEAAVSSPTECCSEVLNDAKKKTTEEEEAMVEYSLARQFLAAVSSKGEVGCPASELALSVSAEHKQVQSLIKRLVSSGQIGSIYRQQGRQRTSYLVTAEFLNRPPPLEFPHHVCMPTRLTFPYKCEVEEEEATTAPSIIEDKRRTSLESPVSSSSTKVMNSSAFSEVTSSPRATASAAPEPPTVLLKEKPEAQMQQQPLTITQERKNRQIHALEILQRERVVPVYEAAQEIRLKEKNSGVMSSAGYMDRRSLNRILNAVLSDSTAGVEMITLDVPKTNKTGKGQESKKESVLKLVSVTSDEVKRWIAKRECANEEKRKELKIRESKASAEKMKKGGGEAPGLSLPNSQGDLGSSFRGGFMNAIMPRTKVLHKHIWNSVMSLEENRKRHSGGDLAAVDLGEILSLLPLRSFLRAFGYPPELVWRSPKNDRKRKKIRKRLRNMVRESIAVPLRSLPKELQFLVQVPWYKNLLMESVSVLEALNILEKKNVDGGEEHCMISSLSVSDANALSHLELGYYRLNNDIKIPLEVEVSTISEFPFFIHKWKDAETFYTMLRTCTVNTQKKGFSGFQLSADLMALIPELGQATAWEEKTMPRRIHLTVQEWRVIGTKADKNHSINTGGHVWDTELLYPMGVSTRMLPSTVQEPFQISLTEEEQQLAVVEIEDQSDEDGSYHLVQPVAEMGKNAPTSSSHHLVEVEQTKKPKSHNERKRKRKLTTTHVRPGFGLSFRAKVPIIDIEDNQSTKQQQPLIDDPINNPLDGESQSFLLEQSYQEEWSKKPLNPLALLRVKQAIISLHLPIPNLSQAVKLSLGHFSSGDVQRALWYMREMTELDTLKGGPCTQRMVEQESNRLMMGTTGSSPFLKLSRAASNLLAPPEKCEDNSIPGFPYPTSFLTGIKDASEMFLRSAGEHDSMLFQHHKRHLCPEPAATDLSLGLASYSTPSNLAVSFGLNAAGCLLTQIDVTPHPDHDITLERGKTPILKLANFEARVLTMECNTSEETTVAASLPTVESYNNPQSCDGMMDSVLNLVNEKMEEGISLEEAGGGVVLPTLCSLCSMKKVMNVPCPSGSLWIGKQYWGEWMTQKYCIKTHHDKKKQQIDGIESDCENQEGTAADGLDLEFKDEFLPTRVWIAIDGSIPEHLLSKLKHWVVGKLLQCPGCSVESVATCIPLVTTTEMVELMHDMELARIVHRSGYGPQTGLGGGPIQGKTCFSLTPRGLEYFKQRC